MDLRVALLLQYEKILKLTSDAKFGECRSFSEQLGARSPGSSSPVREAVTVDLALCLTCLPGSFAGFITRTDIPLSVLTAGRLRETGGFGMLGQALADSYLPPGPFHTPVPWPENILPAVFMGARLGFVSHIV